MAYTAVSDYRDKNTRQVIQENMAMPAPYYPFENIQLRGNTFYPLTGNNDVLRLHEYEKAVFGIGGNDGAEALFDVADGFQVDVILTVNEDNYFDKVGGYGTGFPAYKSRIQLTLTGNNNGHVYLSTRKDGQIKVDSDSISFVMDTPSGSFTDNYIDFRIMAVRALDAPADPTDDDLNRIVDENDDGDVITIEEAETGTTDPNSEDEPPMEENPPADEEEGIGKAVLMGIILFIIGGVVLRFMRGGEVIE